MRRARAATKETSNQIKREYIAIVKCEEDGEELPEDECTKLDQLMDQIGQHEETLHDHDARIERAPPHRPNHENEPSLLIGGLCRTLVADGGTVQGARQPAMEALGERHLVTKALHGMRGHTSTSEGQRVMMASVGASGGFIVPPDYIAGADRGAAADDGGSRQRAAPAGQAARHHAMPRQNQAAIASYGGDSQAIPVSQQAVGRSSRPKKELTALTPVTNDYTTTWTRSCATEMSCKGFPP